MLLQDMEPALGVCARCGVPGLARQGRECNASPRAGQHEERVPPKEARHRLGPCVPSLCPHQAAQPPHTSGARVPGGELQAAPHPWVGAPRFPAICAADLIRNENWVCFSFFFFPPFLLHVANRVFPCRVSLQPAQAQTRLPAAARVPGMQMSLPARLHRAATAKCICPECRIINGLGESSELHWSCCPIS